MYVDHTSYHKVCKLLISANTIYKEYRGLLETNVADFYVKTNWKSLPKCWRESFDVTDFPRLANIIDCTQPLLLSNTVLPLSLLALRVTVKHLQISREQKLHCGINYNPILQSSVLNENKSLFWKHVKVKKKHEIEIMSEICYNMAVQTNCNFVVDIGSGLGHLVRVLSYGYGLNACGLEAQEKLTLQARNLDKKMNKMLRKNNFWLFENMVTCTHLNMKVKNSSNGSDIIKVLEDTFGKDLNFGIVGLHPCGDLAVTLLRFFVKYPRVKFINVVGCCYMKLNTCLTNFGYPISNFSKKYRYNLNYAALEVACHALEMYINKLKSNDFEELKIHSYRAALEKLIIQRHPEMYHSQIGSVKYSDGLTFSQYVTKAISKLNIEISNLEMESEDIKSDLECWPQVVSFYSLRLMLAPLVETIIILDRVLFVIESGYDCYITSAFDPNISPRNYVISAMKN